MDYNMYELTYQDDGQVIYMTEAECKDLFGTDEFDNIRCGNSIEVVAVRV